MEQSSYSDSGSSYSESSYYESGSSYSESESESDSESKTLDLSETDLTEFPEVPDGIERLLLRGNSISEIPEGLPDSIEHIDLMWNSITKIPSKLPKNIKRLVLHDNNINKIHSLDHLENLNDLMLASNQIESISDLPKSLKRLIISQNPISEIRENDLPDTLEELNLSVNPQLLPYLGNLPKDLKRLDISYFNLTVVPKNIPENLTYLSLQSNSIESITEEDNLPESLRILRVCYTNQNGPLKLSNLTLPNLVSLYTNETFYPNSKELPVPPTVLSNCFFSLKCEKYKKHSLETMSRRFASRRTQYLDRSANLIKSRFEFWSLREEGARFRQNVREYNELFG